MKKQIFAVISAAALILSFSSCGKKESTVKIVSDQEPIRVEVGSEIALKVDAEKGETVTWECENTSVAVISSDGKLSGVANGITVVTAETVSGYDHIGVVVGNGVKGTAASAPTVEDGQQTVFTGESKITAIELTLNGLRGDETLIMANGDSPTFKVNVTPSDCTDPITFSSSKTSVATVDADGKVTPVGRGSTTITATAPNGVEGTFTVYVR